jgi:hypothetical protein
MCDYSLFQFPNRLAQDGETLVAHRFSSGCIGFVANTSGQTSFLKRTWLQRNWASLKPWFFPRHVRSGVVAVCIPPGSELRVQTLPNEFRKQYGLDADEVVLFTQLSLKDFTHRDGLRFRTGADISLQRLTPGQRVTVMSLSGIPLPVNSSMSAAALPSGSSSFNECQSH